LNSILKEQYRIFLLVFSLLFASVSVIAQSGPPQGVYKFDTKKSNKKRVKGMNMPDYDSKLLHLGFTLALHYTTFRTTPNDEFANRIAAYQANPDTNSRKHPNTIFGINPVGVPGVTVGFILPNLRLNRFFEFRLQPTFSFYNRYVEFRYSGAKGDSISTQLNQSIYSFIEPAFLLKYHSLRRNNTRMYMLAGLKPGIELGVKRSELDPTMLRLKGRDLCVEYGFGLDLYYPLFKFSPELRFSTGLLNMIYPDNNKYTQILGRMTTHTVTLLLNFEG
jgi:hypothetical protein